MTLDEAIKHCEEVAEENEKFCFKKGGKGGYFNEDTDWNNRKCAKEHRQLAAWLRELKQLREQMNGSVHPNEWIPLIKRPMTKEEREEYEERTGITETMIINCPLPEDGEEVFVSYGGYVSIDTFHDDDSCYFENTEIDDVEAWMPLPLPYKGESE